jgi:hypothetical protein
MPPQGNSPTGNTTTGTNNLSAADQAAIAAAYQQYAAQQFGGATSSTGGALGLAGGSGYEYAPGAAASPYEFTNQLQSTWVVLGSAFANDLGESPTAPVQSGTIIKDFMEANRATQERIEMQLLHAGFYIDTSTGQALAQAPDLGGSDPSNLTAFSLALITAYNQNPVKSATDANNNGRSLSSLVAANIASGAGFGAQKIAPEPVTGGGGTYQNIVTNPADLYQDLYTTFTQTLGRAPRQGELDGFVKTFQQMQGQYQAALNAQAEQANRAKFNQAVASRNTQLAAEVTPQVALGAVPAGPFANAAQWSAYFLNYIQAPVTASNVAFMVSLINANGGWAKALQDHNPLGAALPVAGQTTTVPSTGPAPGGRQSYNTWAQGMVANARNFEYLMPNAMSQLLNGDASNIPASVQSSLQQDLQKWNPAIKALPKPTAAELSAANTVAQQFAEVGNPPAQAPAKAPGTPPTFSSIYGPETIPQPPAAAPSTGPVFSSIYGPETIPQTAAPMYPAGTGSGVASFYPSPGAATTVPGTSADLTNQALRGQQKPGPPAPLPAMATVPAYDVTPGQDQFSMGDTYVSPTTVTGAAAPNPDALAFQMATTGGNAVPYLAQQYLHAFSVIASMIASGQVTG